MSKPIIFPTGITCVFGSSGSGKSTLTRDKLLPQINGPQMIVIDPTHPDPNAHTSARDAASAMYEGQRKVVLRSMDPEQAVPLIYAAWARCCKDNPVYLVCDEASEYLDHAATQKYKSLQTIAQTARHKRLGWAILSQSAVNIAPKIRKQSRSTFWMRMQDHLDIKLAKERIGHKLGAQSIDDFTTGQFIQHPTVTPSEATNDWQRPASAGSY